MNKNESGHAINVVNFENLISCVDGYGTIYNPSNEAIKAPNLRVTLANAKSAINDVNTAQAAYSSAIDAREVAFTSLSKLTTRILSALKATNTTQQVDETVKSLVRKVHGERATPKLTEEEKKTLTENGKEVKEISSSQMGYDNRLENFNKILITLTSIPEYNPNEEDLKITSLKAHYNKLYTQNQAVINTATALSNARIARNRILYIEDSGILNSAASVKQYIKSLYGATSSQFKQVSKIAFRNNGVN